MNTQPNRSAAGNTRKFPYLTDEDLNAPVKVLLVRVFGSYTKRGEQRKDVYEDHYDAELQVPLGFNMGHVKLAANRHVKDVLKGIRARTYNLDRSQKPKQAWVKEEGKPDVPMVKMVRDFISTQGMIDNESIKKDYKERQKREKAQREAMASGNYAPPTFEDDTNYGSDGLPPLKIPGIDEEVE